MLYQDALGHNGLHPDTIGSISSFNHTKISYCNSCNIRPLISAIENNYNRDRICDHNRNLNHWLLALQHDVMCSKAKCLLPDSYYSRFGLILMMWILLNLHMILLLLIKQAQKKYKRPYIDHIKVAAPVPPLNIFLFLFIICEERK